MLRRILRLTRNFKIACTGEARNAYIIFGRRISREETTGGRRRSYIIINRISEKYIAKVSSRLILQ
jgi:hypothetical protein